MARTYIDRSNPYPEWQFYTRYDIQTLPADANEQSIDWKRFVANQKGPRPFNAEQFFRWRCWWDYGTGIAGDLMSHQWDGVNMIMGMGIPDTVATQGGLYYWKEDRQVPDQWQVLFNYPRQELGIFFGCTFHNRHIGTNTFILGRDASIEVHGNWCRLFEAEWKKGARKEPLYEMKRGELEVTSHMRNFIDSVRGLDKPRCGIERAWEEAVVIVMSVESYQRQKMVKWDAAREEIINA
jgi:predicted dehydrogenase